MKTVRDILTLLHQILAFACMNQEKSVVTFIYPKEEHAALRVLNADEYQNLSDYLHRDMDIYKFAILLTLHTGLRIGEICALRWGDISIKSGILKVHQTLQRVKNPDASPTSPKTILQLGSPKTRQSIREIPLTETMKKLCKQYRLENPDIFVLSCNLAFPEPRKLQRRFKQYTDILGLSDVHFHTLRHTFATRCIEAGCDVKALSELLGHASISMTMNRYVHPSMDWKRYNLQKLEQFSHVSEKESPE